MKIPAYTQPKWPTQFGSLDFWWSIYSSFTSFYIGYNRQHKIGLVFAQNTKVISFNYCCKNLKFIFNNFGCLW